MSPIQIISMLNVYPSIVLLHILSFLDFSDDAHTFRARDDSDLFVPSLEDHPDDAVASLDDDIESLRCECRPYRTGIIGALFGNNNNNNG